MNKHRLLSATAVACLLSIAAEAAMAGGRPFSGVISNETIGPLTINGKSCLLENVEVRGNVKVTNSEAFKMIGSTVTSGDVTIIGGGVATLIGNDISGQRVEVSNNERAEILANAIVGNTVVEGNDKADVKLNVIGLSLTCSNNTRLDSVRNEVAGVEACRR